MQNNIAPVSTIVPGDGTRQPATLHLRYFSLVPAAIVVAALYFGRPVLLPLAVGVLFAFALAPVVGQLRRVGVGGIPSVLFAAVLAIAVSGAIGFYITTRTVELAGELPRYQTNLIEKIRSIRGSTMEAGAVERASALLKTLRDQFEAPGRPLSRLPNTDVDANTNPLQVQIQQPEAEAIEVAAALARPLFEFLLTSGIVIIFMIFILLYKEDIRDRFIRLAGGSDIQKTTLLLDEGAERLGYYLLTQTAINAVFGLIVGTGLWLIGIPNPTLWGLAAVILRFIPYAGMPLTAFLPVMLALSVDPGWSMAIWTLLLFILTELAFGQAVEPWLFGRRMGLSPLAIVVAATFWTWLWGPVGLLLSTPLTMCLVVLGRHVEHLKFLDVLLGDRAPLLAEEALYIRLLGDDADQAAAEAEAYLKENTICRYYDSVALKALAIGNADAKRGALDQDRALKIKDSTVALIQNLSEVETDQSERAEAVKKQIGEVGVLCIGGRGPLDEAAALLLVSLLEKADIKARLAGAREASEGGPQESDDKAVKAVCVCYLDPTNAARASFLMRRIKRRMPGAVPIVAFLGTDVGSALGGDGYRVVTTLDSAAQAITAALAEDAAVAQQPSRASPVREEPSRGIGAGIRLEPLGAS